MGEADKAISILRDDRLAPGIGFAQPLGPDGQAIRIDIAVEEGVGVCAPIVTTPTVGVKRGYRLGV